MTQETNTLRMFDRTEVAKLLGVSVRTLDRFRAEEGFPAPLTDKGRPLWSLPQIGKWLGQDRAKEGKSLPSDSEPKQ